MSCTRRIIVPIILALTAAGSIAVPVAASAATAGTPAAAAPHTCYRG